MRASAWTFVACLGAAAAAAPAEEDWFAEGEDGVVELSLAKHQRQGPCAGTLRLDTERRLALWSGVDESFGCKDSFELSFDDLKSVEVLENEPGLLLELKKKPKQMRLIPAPHFQWLMKDAQVSGGNSSYGAGRETVMSGPDGSRGGGAPDHRSSRSGFARPAPEQRARARGSGLRWYSRSAVSP